jgi:D-cysteine desulfhydrase/L-cysteate sulfo-lyase
VDATIIISNLETMNKGQNHPPQLGKLDALPRALLMNRPTPLEPLPNLSQICGVDLYVKRDDCMSLAFGGNKVRQLEYYLGEAVAQRADTILITGAVQSNFVRLAAAAACKLGMHCHIQLEERVAKADDNYQNNGNVLIDRLLGATLHHYPEGEDELGADRCLGELAESLRDEGRRPYIIPLAPGHAPLGALGYVDAAGELLSQFDHVGLDVSEIVVASGSGNTHAGLLFGLRALGSEIAVIGVCVRRSAELQRPRIRDRCQEIAELLDIQSKVSENDIRLTDSFLAPGYGRAGEATLNAIVAGARTEGLMLDPTYTGKTMAGFIDRAQRANNRDTLVFVHTGGTPAIFAYADELTRFGNL